MMYLRIAALVLGVGLAAPAGADGEVATEKPAAEAAAPTGTPSETAKPEAAETPTEWNDLPILEGAYEGSTVRFGYAYKVKLGIDDVVKAYTEKLEAAGWEHENSTRTERSPLGRAPAAHLSFKKETAQTKIVILADAKKEFCLVVLTLPGNGVAK